MQHVVGSRQIQTSATRFQADQKHVALAVLEGVDTSLAFFHRRGTIQILIRNLFAIQLRSQNRQVIHELTEDQCLMFVLKQVINRF